MVRRRYNRFRFYIDVIILVLIVHAQKSSVSTCLLNAPCPGNRVGRIHLVSTGACLIYSSVNIDGWLPETGYPNMAALTTAFLVLNVLAATLDIVSNGWALTMLNK